MFAAAKRVPTIVAFLLVAFAAGAQAAFVTPQPRAATTFIASALARFPVVELDHIGTGNENELELLRQLLAEPDFVRKLDDIVIECGNSRYQAILDRYVAGGQVTEKQVQVVWRKTTQLFGCESDPSTEMLVNLVRDFNRREPGHPLRVLGADPPIDWSAIHTAGQFEAFLSLREQSAASVIQTQVLSKHQKALVVMGGGHLAKRPPAGSDATLTTLLERRNPGSTYVIYAVNDPSRFDGNIRRMLATWPAPVIASIAGTDVGAQSGYAITSADAMHRVGSRWVPVSNAYPGNRLEQLVDAILYLGPADKLRTFAES